MWYFSPNGGQRKFCRCRTRFGSAQIQAVATHRRVGGTPGVRLLQRDHSKFGKSRPSESCTPPLLPPCVKSTGRRAGVRKRRPSRRPRSRRLPGDLAQTTVGLRFRYSWRATLKSRWICGQQQGRRSGRGRLRPWPCAWRSTLDDSGQHGVKNLARPEPCCAPVPHSWRARANRAAARPERLDTLSIRRWMAGLLESGRAWRRQLHP